MSTPTVAEMRTWAQTLPDHQRAQEMANISKGSTNGRWLPHVQVKLEAVTDRRSCQRDNFRNWMLDVLRQELSDARE